MASSPQEKVSFKFELYIYSQLKPLKPSEMSCFVFVQNKWLRALNQAVDQVLGGGAQGSSPGMMGVSRTASYTFSGEGRFKEARYIGGWLAGRVHGR